MAIIPKGLSDEKAARMLVALRGGHTLRKFGIRRNCPRFAAYCEAHPEYAREAIPLFEANNKNSKNGGFARRDRTSEICLKGLHPMTGRNLMVNLKTGRRRCRACRNATRTKGYGKPVDQATIDRLKEAIARGASIGLICWGKPVGGGRTDRSRVMMNPLKFYHLRKINPEFDRFVVESVANNNSRGQTVRWSRWRARVRTAAARNEANDYQKILTMFPLNFPGRDDAAHDVFLALLEGSLQRIDVRARVQQFMTAHNRMFPTKYAKFGDSPLVSLDEVMFDDGSATRGDTVSRGLRD